MILLLACLFILVCYKWGDWKNWKSYYSTTLFLIVGDLIEKLVSAAKPLWHYNSTIFSGTTTALIIVLIIYPCTVLLFIPSYKNSGRIKKVFSLIIWVCIFSALEYLGIKYNYISYFNGWSFSYSFLLDWMLFSLLIVHQKNPPIAWLLSFIVGVVITLWFKLPALY